MTLLRPLASLSPALGLALVAGLIMALAYTAVAARRFRAVPLYWLLGVVGFALGQAWAAHGPRLLPVGTFALGNGIVACVVLFTVLHLVTLWYTGGHRARHRTRPRIRRRENPHR